MLATWSSVSGEGKRSAAECPLDRLLAESSEGSEATLAAWRQHLDSSLLDPDEVSSVEEFYPLGGQAPSRNSFLRVQLQAADQEGKEIFIVRPEREVAHTGAGASSSEAALPQLFRPVASWRAWLPSGASASAPREKEVTWRPWLPMHLTGVQLLHAADAVAAGSLTMPSLRRLTALPGSGFLRGTSWGEAWRIRSVEEHCRSAHLGLWGFAFRLKHSVLAVRLQLQDSEESDLMYLDKNADLGVAWRRAGPGERFQETPRAGHGFTTDMSLHELWDAVTATRAFAEAQEVSNCQHFVSEVLTELSKRGQLQEGGGRAAPRVFELRNQGVADVLRSLGYLSEDCKAPPGSDLGKQAWRTFMSWDCKAGAMRFATPWLQQFKLRPAELLAHSSE